MAVVAILDLLESATKLHSSCATPVKVSSWSAKWFSSYKDLNYFLSFMFESPIHTPPKKLAYITACTTVQAVLSTFTYQNYSPTAIY